MRSYKPLSTVSFNTEDHLKTVLDLLVKDNTISFYAYVKHNGDDLRKDHFHVFIEPVGVIDTNSEAWKNLLVQIVLNESDPLNCLPWRKSKFEDWILYSRHDSYYLASKGLKKNVVNYPIESFVSSSVEKLLREYEAIDKTKYLSPAEKMLDCYLRGLTPFEAMIELRIPYGCMNSFLKGYNLISDMEKKFYVNS